MITSQRPMGVTILAVLAIIGGILELLGGLLSLVGGGVTATEDAATGGGLAMIGVFIAILGALNLIFGFGALALKPWAWKFGVGLQIFAILAGLVQLPNSIVGIVINGLILYYLFRPNVKRIFGRA
jgi:hypothetical protein